MNSLLCRSACCLCVYSVSLFACDSASSTRQTPDTTQVQPDTVQAAPDTLSTDTTARNTDTSAVPPADTTQSGMIEHFTGTIQGFEAKTFSFSLTSPLSVRIQAVPADVAFKLYQTTATLPESKLDNETARWSGELDPGNYQLKVFFPLKKAAQKKKTTFQVTIQEQK